MKQHCPLDCSRKDYDHAALQLQQKGKFLRNDWVHIRNPIISMATGTVTNMRQGVDGMEVYFKTSFPPACAATAPEFDVTKDK